MFRIGFLFFSILFQLFTIGSFSQKKYTSNDINTVIKKMQQAVSSVDKIHYSIKVEKYEGLDFTGSEYQIWVNRKPKSDKRFKENEFHIQGITDTNHHRVYDGNNLFLSYTTNDNVVKSVHCTINTVDSFKQYVKSTLLYHNISSINTISDMNSFLFNLMVDDKILRDTIIGENSCYALSFKLKSNKIYTPFKNIVNHYYVDKKSYLPIVTKEEYTFEGLEYKDIAHFDYHSVNTPLEDSLFNTYLYKKDNTFNNLTDYYFVENKLIDTLNILNSRPFMLSDSQSVYLKDLKGKVVILDFWFRNCPPCLKLMPVLNNIHQQYQNKGVVIIGVNDRDNFQVVRDYLSLKNYHYPSTYNTEFKWNNALQINSYPVTYIIDKEGNLSHISVGFDKGYYKEITSVIDKLLDN